MKSILVAFGISSVSLLSGSVGATPGVQPNAPSVQAPRAGQCEGGRVQGDRALARYARCQRVSGDLTVSGVSNFKPLLGLKQVDGTLRLTKNAATALALAGLRQVDTLVVDSNPRLEEISGLDALTSAKRIEIRGNSELKSFDGPAHLQALDELVIKNTNLIRLSGFESLSEIKNVSISGNSRLINVGALDGVKRTARLELVANNRLCACFGLFRGLEIRPAESIIQNNRTLFPSELGHLAPLQPERVLAGRFEKRAQ